MRMRYYFRRIFLIFFTFAMLLSFHTYAYGVQQQKRVLVLSSYSEAMDWTKDLSVGIIDTLRKADNNCAINIEYMDWKDYPEKENLANLQEYYKYKYKDKVLDVILACDDVAFQFALEYRKQLFSNAPIVFCGVNQESLAKIRKNYHNFTGVIEVADPTETVELALKINPLVKKVYLAYDNTESGISTAKLFRQKIEDMKKNLEIIPLNKYGFDELLQILGKLKKDSIVLFPTYNSDSKGNILEYGFALREMSRSSKVPIYHQYDFGLKYGAFGGNLISAKLYGKYAAEMVLQILDGVQADRIEILYTRAAKKTVDYSQFKKFNIFTKNIPEGTKIVNKPFSFFETYWILILIVILIFVLLLSLLISLLFYTRKIARMRQELIQSNEELSARNEEILVADEELNDKYLEICRIQSDLSISEGKFTYLAFHDVLTGVLNRRSLFEDARKLFSTDSGIEVALLFVDMDNFKYINDTMGHEFGDELIKSVSERLSNNLHENCVLYRLGGDEFIVLMPGVIGQGEVERLAQNTLLHFKDFFVISNSAIRVSASIGVAIYPDHGRSIEDLLKAADIAMYKAKESGKNQYVVYNDRMNEAFHDRMILEKHLHFAMERQEFELYYQPQINVNCNKITGFEALLRWNSAELGMVSPMKFIEVAEITHLIIPLGEWVLNQACEFLSRLHRSGYPDLTVSVNISTIQLLQADFTDKVMGILKRYNLKPQYLELEITETVLIESFDAVTDKLNLLSANGISIALDDFGKGYSSLNYLNQLPISTMKIDKSFIDNIVTDLKYQAIVGNTIGMGKSLGITVVAEGVEDEDQLQCLKKYNCDTIQGYLFSKPLPENEIHKLLEKRETIQSRS